MTEQIASQLLLCGLHPDNVALVKEILPRTPQIIIPDMAGFENFLESPPDVPIPMVLCGETLGELSPTEMAQTFRMQYSQAKIFYISKKREAFDRALLLKNGFDDAFLMPFDERIVRKKLLELRSMVDAGAEVVFRPVKMIDLKPSAVIDFDVSVYLPTTNRHIKFAASGEPLDEARVERLGKHNVTNMYVDVGDMKKFYKYSAERLVELGKSGSIGETERVERLENSVRLLFTGIFSTSDGESSLQEGRAMLEDCQEIVKSYILADSEKEWYKAISENIGTEGDSYSHHTRVSTFAGMFSIALEKGSPADFATAGLFHDLGLGEIPEELQKKKYEEMTDEEKELWELHPSISVKLLKMKKIPVPLIVYEMIEQHHERFDGSGFPKGITAPKLKVESQILAMADEFDYLTCAEQLKGDSALTPTEAIKKMAASGAFEIELVSKLVKLFPEK
ncbi:HD domain-containing protein [bacterium]|nr:HD domain-containing protein [bacterium]